jgi:hypothetical protein
MVVTDGIVVSGMAVDGVMALRMARPRRRFVAPRWFYRIPLQV